MVRGPPGLQAVGRYRATTPVGRRSSRGSPSSNRCWATRRAASSSKRFNTLKSDLLDLCRPLPRPAPLLHPPEAHVGEAPQVPRRLPTQPHGTGTGCPGGSRSPSHEERSSRPEAPTASSRRPMPWSTRSAPVNNTRCSPRRAHRAASGLGTTSPRWRRTWLAAQGDEALRRACLTPLETLLEASRTGRSKPRPHRPGRERSRRL